MSEPTLRDLVNAATRGPAAWSYEQRSAIRLFVALVNARAEADVLRGNPLTVAHHRALCAELAALEE